MLTPEELLNKQNELYEKLLELNNSDNSFTFWLMHRSKNVGPQNNKVTLRFRFNCSDGYTNVGIVKITSESKLQLIGFHFTNDFKTCQLKIVRRKDDKDIQRILKAAKDAGIHTKKEDINRFLNKMEEKLSNESKTISDFDTSFINWLKTTYGKFFKAVEEYDNNNNTHYSRVLKIEPELFDKMRTLNDKAFEKYQIPTQNKSSDKGFPDKSGTNKTKSLQIPLNQILYGPPGTGKTYHTVEKSLRIIKGEDFVANNTNPVDNGEKEKFQELKKEFDAFKGKGQIVFTTFHQSMSYEDFVEGIKPITTEKGDIIYEVKPGIFKEICSEAEKNKGKNYVLIIDEINRGNVSQIFGELITLLEDDKRLKNEFELKVRLPYSQNDFGIPSNLFIIGTMNTADRSVEALDTALRRRFSFVEMMPNSSLLKEIDGINLKDILETINKRIVILKDREHQIGHSYFMKCETSDDIKCVFKDRIVPLLQEYFYGNYENICLVLGKEFVKKESNDMPFADGATYDGDIDQSPYRLLTASEWKDLDIRIAIKSLLNKKNNKENEDL